VELDVRASRDGVPVVIHDETLERTHGRSDRVASLRADELEALGVASMADVFEALPRRSFVDVELKEDLGRPAVEVLVAARGPGLQRAVVSSFDPGTLARVHGLAPAWPIWLIADDLANATLTTAASLGCSAVAAHWQAVDEASIRGARALGLGVMAWTVRRRPTVARLIRLGVAALCLEGPALDA
jgi:glycerophosphoryl diester phosphodiesterase